MSITVRGFASVKIELVSANSGTAVDGSEATAVGLAAAAFIFRGFATLFKGIMADVDGSSMTSSEALRFWSINLVNIMSSSHAALKPG